MVRVAYFGSDQFSVNCLQRLLGSKKLTSLHVVTKSPKPAGRYRKQLQDTPIAEFSTQLGLKLHRADTNSDINRLLSCGLDLCIAVSYGKLIPANFLSELKYGGLNVHPSLLPRHSGPAPLHRALLDTDEPITGCTLQTLHPTEFDRGHIVMQEQYAIAPRETIQSLSTRMSALGGDMLRKCVDDGIYAGSDFLQPSFEFSYASKIKPDERRIEWNQYSSDVIMRRFRTLGALFTFKRCYLRKQKQYAYKRVVLNYLVQPKVIPDVFTDRDLPGSFKMHTDGRFYVKTVDSALRVAHMTFQGEPPNELPSRFISRLEKRTRDSTRNIFENEK